MESRGAGRPIVVGVDGSDSALRAVRWAAAEAARRGVTLLLRHAFGWPGDRHIGDISEGATYREVLLHTARRMLRDGVAAAQAAAPSVQVTADLRVGHPVELLVYESQSAAMVVVGSRGLGGFSGLFTGSVAVGVAAHGSCPVVVVRGLEDPVTSGAVVVGLDGSPTSEAALAFAYDAADARGVALVAVHAWQDLVVDGVLDWESVVDDEHRALAERLAGWAEKYPDVPVRRLVVHGSTLKALMRAAQGAQLLVVGSRGHGGFAGLLLGSTSQAVIHHARCPVAVIRADVPGGQGD